MTQPKAAERRCSLAARIRPIADRPVRSEVALGHLDSAAFLIESRLATAWSSEDLEVRGNSG
jgi:hypothetical protein